jgi:hypothetical protein
MMRTPVAESGLNDGQGWRFRAHLLPLRPAEPRHAAWRSAQAYPKEKTLKNVTSPTPGSSSGTEQNLTTAERGAYIVAGLGLAAAGVKPRPNPLLNVIALLGGSYLAWRGYVGSCPVKAALMGPEGLAGHLTHHG